MKKFVQPWTPAQLNSHKQAARRLEQIFKQAAAYAANKRFSTEEQIHKFIVDKIQKMGMTSSLNWAIVAYGPSAADPHYQFKSGKSRRVKPGHFLLLDIWGKLNRPDAPYADITRMYYIGKNPPARFQKLWYDVKEARDRALDYLKQNHAARGLKLHGIAKSHLDSCGHQGCFPHGLGHDLGIDQPHGPGTNLNPKSRQPLIRGRGYTIEPGIYKKGQFGVRSEINFFLDKNGKVNVTTVAQKNLICLLN